MQTSYGQNKALPYALNYLSKTLGTEVKASHIDISFFDEIQLDDVLVLDSKGDTLLYVSRLESDIGLFSFFNRKLKIDNLKLKGAKINLEELSNGKYNFDHILTHLAPKDTIENINPSEPWDISLSVLEFVDTQFDFSSKESRISAIIPKFEGDLKVFSVQESIYHFKNLSIDGIQFAYDKSDYKNIDQLPTSFPSLPFTLMADDISINSTGITYNTAVPQVKTAIFDPNHINIDNLKMEGEDFYWSDSMQVDLKMLSAKTSDGFELTNLSTNLFLSSNSANFDNTQIQTLSSNMSFDGSVKYSSFDVLINDILSTNSNIDFQNSTISKSDISYFLEENAIPEININTLQDIQVIGKLLLENGKLDAEDISVKIGNEFIFEGSLSASDLVNFSTSRQTFNITKFETNQSFIERLIPTFKLPKELNDLGHLKGSAKGDFSLDQLTLESINFNSSKGTNLSGKGKIYALQSGKAPEIDFTFKQLETNLNSLFSDKTILPEEVQRLDDIQFSGLIKGNIHKIIATGNLKTSLGDLELDAKAKFNDNYTDATYEGYINLHDFDIGTMLNDTTLGVTNFEGNIKGSGLTIENLKTTIDGKIKSIYYDGNIYQDIVVDGKYSSKIFDGKIVSNDKNLSLNIEGKLDLSGTTTVLDFTVDMTNLDLKELGITDSLMVIGGIFQGKIKGNSLDDFIGEGEIKDFCIQTQKGSYSADSTVAIKVKEINELAKVYSINSPFLEGEIKGNIKPSKLIRIVKNYIKTYIPLEIGYNDEVEKDPYKYFEELDDQNFIFSAKTKDINPFLTPFLGDNISIEGASIGAYFSSEETRLDVKGIIDSLLYKGILLQRGSYFFDGRKDFINGNINIEDISMGNEILVPQTTINIILNNKIADFNLVMANEDDVERLNLGGDFKRTDEYFITFKDSVLLNGYSWAFSPYNQVIYGDSGLYLQDLSISKDKQAITIYTDLNKNGEAIEILFDNFILSELTAIIDKENDYFEGNINGSLLINSVYSKPFITADLYLKNITIAGNEAGNLSIEAEQDLATNSVKSNIQLFGPQNDAAMTLEYGINNQTTVGELDINKLEMAIVDPYLTDIFINSEGAINGKIKINGDLKNLDLVGKIFTHNVKTTPVFTNSRYDVMDTEISFSTTEIGFGTVELKDKNQNSAFVTGKIRHQNLRNSIVDLKVYTDNFEFLNTTSNENELFYGNVNVSGNVSVFGPTDKIEIDGSVSAINNSKLIVSPLSLEQELFSDDFIIYSGDPRIIPFDSLRIEAKSTKVNLPFDIDLEVNVQKDSEFSMIMDPLTGDKITCNGESNLNLKLNKKGEMELFGTYTVSKGTYTFSWGPLTKEFIIQPGSTVKLNGDPLEGLLDLDAIYVANTSVYDLLQLESDLSDSQKSEAQRKRDINVILNLTNSIQKPEIKLDITSNKDDLSSISEILTTKLAQLRSEPDELNNQVFGLLLFGNFILAKNAETDLAKTGTDIAISSLSGLVSSQLNKLADGLIEGFELNFDVNSYSSDFLALGEGGVITELGLGIKKTLFDSRLTISAETNVNLESSAKASDFNTIAGDFILEYKLNKNGNYVVKAFRKSTANRLGVDETSSKNGASIFITKEFGEVQKKKN